MRANPKEELNWSRILERIEFFLNILNQMCIGFVFIYMTWLCFKQGLGTMELHAWLVTLGFSLLMAEAIMSHYNANPLTFTYKRITKTLIHSILQILGGGCGIAGCLIMLIPLNFVPNDTHGRLGFATFILCIISMLSGLCALFSSPIKRILSPLLNKTFHNIIGIATFVIALVAQYYGYYYFRHDVDAGFLILLKTLTLISLVLTNIGPLKALYQKCCTMKENLS